MEIKQLVEALPSKYQAAFCALNCERMLQSIAKFDEYEASAAVNSFEKSIAAIYAFSIISPVNLDEFSALKDEVESYWPDLDESKNEFASYAFDAFVAMSEALNFVLTGDTIHVANCTAAVMDTVDMYIQETSEYEPPAAQLEAFIQASPFMQRELKRQVILLEELEKTPVIDLNSIAYLKNLNDKEPLIDFTTLSYS